MFKESSSLTKIILWIIAFFIFACPLFFLPVTQEFFATHKFFLIQLVALLLLVLECIQLIIRRHKEMSVYKTDGFFLAFLLSIALSTIFMSPSKIQALLNPTFGLLLMLGLAVIFRFITSVHTSRHHFLSFPSIFRKKTGEITLHKIMHVMMWVISAAGLITCVMIAQPFKALDLPVYLQFLKNPYFTTVGNILDLLILLGFALVYGIAVIFRTFGNQKLQSNTTFVSITVSTIITALTFITILFFFLNPLPGTQPLQLPPYNVSWYAAVETLKQPLRALLGVGIDNYASIFTIAKDASFIQSDLWQISSFNVARSAILHIFTETGVVGLATFVLFLVSLGASLLKEKPPAEIAALFIYMVVVLVLFPPSLIVFFLLFMAASFIPHTIQSTATIEVREERHVPLLIVGSLVCIITLGAGGYFLGQAYAAEVFFKRGLDAAATGDANGLYNNQRQAILLNPYSERNRTGFAQTNLLIANSIAEQLAQEAETADPAVTEQNRQTATQAIQAAISEAKAVVTLNPNKAVNWETLASIYRNILSVAEGADAWTISSYQRAIVLDPQNPLFRLNLGGVYYSLGNYAEAATLFEQAAVLKPDWSNAYYNYAWAAYQSKNYAEAVAAMERVIGLLNPETEKADYDKAVEELTTFRKSLPQQAQTQGEEPSEPTEEQSRQLSLPTPPVATVEPKIELPIESQPPQTESPVQNEAEVSPTPDVQITPAGGP